MRINLYEGKDSFFKFTKVYFNDTLDYFRDNNTSIARHGRPIKKKNRIPVIIIGYIYFITSCICCCFQNQAVRDWAFIFAIGAIVHLLNARFSILYYLFLYLMYKTKKTGSFNDQVIIANYFDTRLKESFWKIIKKYFEVMGESNIFRTKYYLQDKSKQYNQNNKKKKPNTKKQNIEKKLKQDKNEHVLKITYNAIFFDKEKVFDKIFDIEVLENFLKTISEKE